jgi:hypothetical protein
MGLIRKDVKVTDLKPGDDLTGMGKVTRVTRSKAFGEVTIDFTNDKGHKDGITCWDSKSARISRG